MCVYGRRFGLALSSVVLKCAEPKPAFLRPIEKAVLLAVAVALAFGIGATLAGGVLHKEKRFIPECYREGCPTYHLYGWPWEWKASAPEQLREFQDTNRPRSWRYGDNSIQEKVLMITVAMWGSLALTAEAGLAIAGWGSWRLLVKRKAASA